MEKQTVDMIVGPQWILLPALFFACSEVLEEHVTSEVRKKMIPVATLSSGTFFRCGMRLPVATSLPTPHLPIMACLHPPPGAHGIQAVFTSWQS